MASFVSLHGGNIREAAQRAGIAPEALLDFSANINPLGMPPGLRAALVAQLSLAERYPDVEYQALYQTLARHHQVDEGQLMAGNGETELIFALVNYLAPRRGMVVIPGFAEYRRALSLAGCQVEDYSLREADGWQLTGAFLNALHPDLDCLFLCTPNNPTGLLPDRQLIEKIAHRCRTLDIQLILDEAFLDFTGDDAGMIGRLDAMPHVWVLRSLTKFYAIPGLRLGYLVGGNREGIAEMRRRQQPWTINAFAALAGERVLDDRDYHNATFAWLHRARPALLEGLARLGGITVWPGVANYLFLRCDIPGLELQAALLGEGILIRHCVNYPGLDSRYYRVAVKSEAANDRLLGALNKVLTDVMAGN